MPVSTSIEHVTAEKAEELLKDNTANRTISFSRVEDYADAMKKKLWHFDGAPIRFSDTGVLLDGQHRLLAVKSTGLAQDFLIVRGLDEESQIVMDTGKGRSLADILSMRGEKNHLNLASAIVAIYKFERGDRGNNIFTGQAPHIEELLKFFGEHEDKIRAATQEALKLRRTVPISVKGMAVGHWVFDQINKDDTADFFAKFGSGANLTEDSPILVLRNRIYRDEEDRKNKGVQRLDFKALGLTIKAWNFYRTGVTVSKLQYSTGGTSPEKFPEAV